MIANSMSQMSAPTSVSIWCRSWTVWRLLTVMNAWPGVCCWSDFFTIVFINHKNIGRSTWDPLILISKILLYRSIYVVMVRQTDVELHLHIHQCEKYVPNDVVTRSARPFWIQIEVWSLRIWERKRTSHTERTQVRKWTESSCVARVYRKWTRYPVGDQGRFWKWGDVIAVVQVNGSKVLTTTRIGPMNGPVRSENCTNILTLPQWTQNFTKFEERTFTSPLQHGSHSRYFTSVATLRLSLSRNTGGATARRL